MKLTTAVQIQLVATSFLYTSVAFVPPFITRKVANRPKKQPLLNGIACSENEGDGLASASLITKNRSNRRDAFKKMAGAAVLPAIQVSTFPSSSTAADKEASYLGPLADLVGTWKGNGGLSITGVPSRKSEPSAVGAFELLVRPYEEKITFEAIPELVKNRGGSIDQFNGVLTYKKEVWATDDDPGLIHVENGMLFYLDNIQNYSDGTPNGSSAGKPPFSVACSATVPHGNSAMIFGSHEIFGTTKGAKFIPDIDARPTPSLPEGTMYTNPYLKSKYNAVNPNQILKDAAANQNMKKTTYISLDSKNNGEITNTPFIKGRADTTGFHRDLWIETVQQGKDNIQQLQYSEFVDVLFHRPSKDSSELINWPHVMVNTLTKEAWIPKIK